MIHQGEVADGWRLIRVQGNAATFAREGREITLSLAKREYDAGGGTTPANAVSRQSSSSLQGVPGKAVALAARVPGSRPQQPNSPSVAAPSASVGSAATNGTDKTVVVPRSVVDMARTNPGAAMQGLQIEAYMPNGQMQGFTIANVAEGAVAAPYVAQGDRILAVNGNPITSMSSAMSIYQQLVGSSSTSVTVTIERGGRRQDVIYNIK